MSDIINGRAVGAVAETIIKRANELDAERKVLAVAGMDLIEAACELVFAAVSEAHVIRWNQYTPYFNDGDSCVFRLNEPGIFTEEQAEAEEDGIDIPGPLTEEDHKMSAEQPTNKWWNDYMTRKAAEWNVAVEEHGLDEATARYAASQALYRLFDLLDTSVFEEKWGDHVTVTASRDGTFTAEEYVHD